MDQNRYGLETAMREARRRLADDLKLQYFPSATHKYDTTTDVHATQAESLTGLSIHSEVPCSQRFGALR
jgi:hypothetical protein